VHHTRHVAPTNELRRSQDLFGSWCLPTRSHSLRHTNYSIRSRIGKGSDLLVASNILALLEMELIYDRVVVRIPFFHVRMSSCEVGRDEAEICVMILEPDGDGSFVPRHPSHPRLGVINVD